jgi:hypothetical protein
LIEGSSFINAETEGLNFGSSATESDVGVTPDESVGNGIKNHAC